MSYSSGSGSSTADSYIRQIKDIDSALKRLNQQTADLRKKKKEASMRLYAWMEKNNVETYSSIDIRKIAPKQRAKKKPPKKRKEDAIILFSQIGVNDPEKLWEEFQRTQKAEQIESEQIQ
jgi:hypothetical protein